MPHTFRLFQRFLWILLLCACVPLATGCENRRTIVHDLEERDANEILDFLNAKGVNALKVQSAAAAGGGGNKAVVWDITVDEQDAPRAMALLIQNGLPRRRSENLLNIFAPQSLVPSEMSEKIRYQAGLGEQIASTIRKMDGVLDAEVQISFPEENPFQPEQTNKQKITASVYVKYSPLLEDPNAHLVTKIKRLVASSVPSLDFNNVTVILDKARFSDIQQFGAINPSSEEKHYVSIWSVIVSDESVTRFRAIFFSFIVAILLLILFITWLIWKLYPVMGEFGGFKSLFKLHHLELQRAKKEEDSSGDSEQQPPPPPPTTPSNEGSVT